MGFTIRVQAIKAKALNVKAVQREVQKALEETGKILQKEFGKTTESWQGAKPTFQVTTGGMASRAFVHCFPGGDEEGVEKWVRLDEGTEHNYPIAARKAPMLVYQSEFSPKTTPGSLSSKGGGKSGPYDRRRKQVIHPGVDPRNWSQTLGEQEEDAFADRIQAAVEKGLEE
ncbi:MAG: hypothetical protein EHM35_00650 [Planctomycetaceae bacterium]|nr:MAG: hypothetical protein EHM35_00650 [Planctomycetaceae bacterium]